MPSLKQGNIKYYFLSLWYDSTWDWTPVSRAIRNAHLANIYNIGFLHARTYAQIWANLNSLILNTLDYINDIYLKIYALYKRQD